MLPKLPDEDEGGMLLMLLLLAQPAAAVRRQRAAWPDVDMTRRENPAVWLRLLQ